MGIFKVFEEMVSGKASDKTINWVGYTSIYMDKPIAGLMPQLKPMSENKTHIYLKGSPFPEKEVGYTSLKNTDWLGYEWETHFGTLQGRVYKIAYVFNSDNPTVAIACAKAVKKKISSSLNSPSRIGEGILQWVGKDGEIILQTALFMGGTVNVFITGKIWA